MPQLSRTARLFGRIFCIASIVVVVVFATAFLLSGLIALIRGEPWLNNFYVGLVCSLITWLFVAVFHWRKETVSLPFQNRNEFLVEIREVMQEMGYDVKSQNEDCSIIRFRPRFRSLVLGGGVQLSIVGQAGKITGSRVCLEVLRNRLRVRHHLDKMQQQLENSRLLNDAVHQRVQVGLRLNPEQLQSVLDEVIKVLADKGEVVCYLKILARNESGIPQSMIDGRIRAWLRNHGIAAEIQKDTTKRSEPAKEEDVVSV